MQNFAKRSAALRRQKHYDEVMRTHVHLARPHRSPRAARRLVRPTSVQRNIARQGVTAPSRDIPTAPPSSSWVGFQPDPYLDYGRFLTPEGGILITFKDFDLRLRHTLWRLFAWSTSTGLEAWFLLTYSPLQNEWLTIACLAAIAVVNWLIVAKPVEIYRNIEIRPDCMIIEGADIFWMRYMENGWPAFHPDKEGNQVLSGIYGTRFVEYLTVRRFDEFDRAPDVFAAHLQDAMQQLWTRPF